MTNKEINKQVKEKVMGYVPCDQWGTISLGIAGGICGVKGDCGHGKCYPSNENIPFADYCENIQAAFEMQARIQELQWGLDFGDALLQVVDEERIKSCKDPMTLTHIAANWACANATPMQRCLAALEVVKNHGIH